jgi:hypothetical protein
LDDCFWIEEQKSAVAIATGVRDPKPTVPIGQEIAGLDCSAA